MDMDLHFRELGNTIEGCLQLLRLLKYGDSYQCPHCGGTEYTGISTRERVVVCASCHDQESLTAGTLFERAQIPLTTIFQIIFDAASDAPSSAAELARELGISHATALRWLHKVRSVIEGFFTPTDQQSVHCSLMRKVLFKPSCESSPVLNPVCDIETAPALDEAEPSELGAPQADTSDSNTTDPSPSEKWFSAQSLQNGDRFQIRTSEDINMQNIQTPIDGKSVFEVIMFIARIFQGVSRKFSQLYAAQFMFAKLHAGQFRALLTACFRTGPIRDVDIMSYTSPQLIILPASI